MREAVIENEFVKAVRKAGGVAYKLTSQTTNGPGLPDQTGDSGHPGLDAR